MTVVTASAVSLTFTGSSSTSLAVDEKTKGISMASVVAANAASPEKYKARNNCNDTLQKDEEKNSRKEHLLNAQQHGCK